MKTKSIYTILLAILFGTNSFSQTPEKEGYLAISAGVDVRNALVGSEYTSNKPSLDFLGKFSMVGNNIEVNVGFESFKKIGFNKYTVGVGYHFPLYGRIGNTVIKTSLIPSIEPTIIDRWGEEWETRKAHFSFFSVGANIALRWHLTDHISSELLLNALPRVDLSVRYPEIHNSVPIVCSVYAMIIYKFHENP
jgi:hypothetical protein